MNVEEFLDLAEMSAVSILVSGHLPVLEHKWNANAEM